MSCILQVRVTTTSCQTWSMQQTSLHTNATCPSRHVRADETCSRRRIRKRRFSSQTRPYQVGSNATKIRRARKPRRERKRQHTGALVASRPNKTPEIESVMPVCWQVVHPKTSLIYKNVLTCSSLTILEVTLLYPQYFRLINI